MLYVESDGTIKLTRGDTARLTVSAINETTNDSYIFDEKDTLVITIKKSTKDTSPLIQKTIIGSNIFTIEPNDTSSLSFGSYKYDVELRTDGGDVFTIIGPTTFEILHEVTC